ncbi:cell division inhibitor MinD [Hydrogenibacillus schlegelii]|uniref:septum site-determining protein MinD n=1 Tax=Hydrogenibacillus schlegelii TaxID=1484 RepID=UPI0007982C0F|nr:septum site-determining protein MinD [Hydrogenibacillus schlegelii]KWW97331.1 cell division inhibitor MinD [Hydrogenibacillus schlegelii]
MGEVIVVTSGKGGVGKTTTVANIGTALAMLGKSVVLIDTDIGLRNLDLVLGLENRIVYDLVDVAEGSARLEQALVRDKRFEDRLVLLPAAQVKDKTALKAEALVRIVEALQGRFDYVFLDSPAGIEQGVHNAVAGARQAIVVTTPEVSAIRDADRVIGLLEKRGLYGPKLIINRLRPHMVRSGEQVSIEEIVQILGIDLLGVVPDDEAVIKMTNEGTPVVIDGRTPAATAYRNIARRILGEHVPLMKLDDRAGMLAKVRRLFGL